MDINANKKKSLAEYAVENQEDWLLFSTEMKSGGFAVERGVSGRGVYLIINNEVVYLADSEVDGLIEALRKSK